MPATHKLSRFNFVHNFHLLICPDFKTLTEDFIRYLLRGNKLGHPSREGWLNRRRAGAADSLAKGRAPAEVPLTIVRAFQIFTHCFLTRFFFLTPFFLSNVLRINGNDY